MIASKLAPQGLRPAMSWFSRLFQDLGQAFLDPKINGLRPICGSIGRYHDFWPTPIEFHIFSGPISAMGQRTHGRSHGHGCFILSLADAWRPKFGLLQTAARAHLGKWGLKPWDFWGARFPDKPIFAFFFSGVLRDRHERLGTHRNQLSLWPCYAMLLNSFALRKLILISPEPL